jgi:DNA-binding MarR family transcriptional regulator
MTVPDHDPAQAIHRELNVFARRVRALANRLHPDLSFVAYTLLGHAHASGGCRAVDLATLFQLDKSTVSRQVGDLGRRGLLERVPAGRGHLLRVTDAGRAELAAAADRQRAALDDRLAGWDPADLRAFAAYLRHYNAADGSRAAEEGRAAAEDRAPDGTIS